MEITFSQILDIKCILSGRTKKQIANDLCISQMTLSREIRDNEILKDLDDYFNDIDPEINILCDKLRKTQKDFVEDGEVKYGMSDVEKLKFNYNRLKNDHENFQQYYNRKWNEWQDEKDRLLKKIWDLGGDREDFNSANAV